MFSSWTNLRSSDFSGFLVKDGKIWALQTLPDARIRIGIVDRSTSPRCSLVTMAGHGSKSGHDNRYQSTDTSKGFACCRSQAGFANGSQAKSHSLVKLLCNHMPIKIFPYKTPQRNAALNTLLNPKFLSAEGG
jgi:hypothetical protein